jgi:hypothetical protein
VAVEEIEALLLGEVYADDLPSAIASIPSGVLSI